MLTKKKTINNNHTGGATGSAGILISMIYFNKSNLLANRTAFISSGTVSLFFSKKFSDS